MQDECSEKLTITKFSCKTTNLNKFECNCMFINTTTCGERNAHIFPDSSYFNKWTNDEEVSSQHTKEYTGSPTPPPPPPRNIKSFYEDYCKLEKNFTALSCITYDNCQLNTAFCHCLSKTNGLPFTLTYAFNTKDIWQTQNDMIIFDNFSTSPFFCNDISTSSNQIYQISNSCNQTHDHNYDDYYAHYYRSHIAVPIILTIQLMLLIFLIFKCHEKIKRIAENKLKSKKTSRPAIVYEL